MNESQSSFDFTDKEQKTPIEPQRLQPGEVRTIGNYQVRNFKGYYQSREGRVGHWQFHISSFDSSTSGSSGKCWLILAGGGLEEVPIDANDRITVDGTKFGRKNWKH